LISVDDGQVTGLHELRSAALVSATHAVPPPTIVSTCALVIGWLTAPFLRPFVANLLNDETQLDEPVLVMLRDRLMDSESAPDEWTAAFQALRVVDFRRSAVEWTDILRRHRVAPAYRGLTLQFAGWGGDFGGLSEVMRPEIVGAVEEIKATATGASPLRDCSRTCQ